CCLCHVLIFAWRERLGARDWQLGRECNDEVVNKQLKGHSTITPTVMRADFKDEFEKLWRSNNPAKRGHAFEELFCRLLFKSGFIVHKDPKSAKPRQTDLLAEYGDETFLFETKWLGRKVDIDAVAQIKDRLGRTSKRTVGCICSVSGFTETLISDVERHH